jgi:aldehyde:ferredoxin oxidoreductase
MFGYTGSILHLNLSKKTISTIETEKYGQWIGGHGIAAAIFFDLVKDKTVKAFDPENTLVLMSGRFAGTLAPAASRMEIVGVQSQTFPHEWFGSANMGGRFPAMLKYAGFDGIVIEGQAESPTWINITDGKVGFEEATGLWGLDTYDTQRVIFRKVLSQRDERREGGTAQLPAVLAIGPAGENLSRIGTIQQGAGSAFGQGGFGGVWGAKNLKAISALGSGSVEVADPRGLFDTTLWARATFGADLNDPQINPWQEYITSHFGGHPGRRWAEFDKQRRPHGCFGCHLNCRPRTSSTLGNDGVCIKARWYQTFDIEKHGRVTEITGKATELFDRMGINAFEVGVNVHYLLALRDRGLLGKGAEIATDIDLDRLGETDFITDLLHKIAFRKDIGADLAEGFPRAAERWGRVEEDLKTGILKAAAYGYPIHYDPRTEAYWGYASVVSSRDINCHDFNVAAYWMPNLDITAGRTPVVTAEEASRIIASKCAPYHDPQMIDFSEENVYSLHMAHTTAWLLHYASFWKRSCGLCDNAFADFINPYGPDNAGITPAGEIRLFQNISGEDTDFTGSIAIGHKIFTLDRAIWTLQGRHRDQEVFPEYMYNVPSQGVSYIPGQDPCCYMPVFEKGRWEYRNVVPRHLDREKVESWKTVFYELEGYDQETGWPTRQILESFGMDEVKKEIDAKGKLLG